MNWGAFVSGHNGLRVQNSHNKNYALIRELVIKKELKE